MIDILTNFRSNDLKRKTQFKPEYGAGLSILCTKTSIKNTNFDVEIALVID